MHTKEMITKLLVLLCVTVSAQPLFSQTLIKQTLKYGPSVVRQATRRAGQLTKAAEKAAQDAARQARRAAEKATIAAKNPTSQAQKEAQKAAEYAQKAATEATTAARRATRATGRAERAAAKTNFGSHRPVRTSEVAPVNNSPTHTDLSMGTKTATTQVSSSALILSKTTPSGRPVHGDIPTNYLTFPTGESVPVSDLNVWNLVNHGEVPDVFPSSKDLWNALERYTEVQNPSYIAWIKKFGFCYVYDFPQEAIKYKWKRRPAEEFDPELISSEGNGEYLLYRPIDGKGEFKYMWDADVMDYQVNPLLQPVPESLADPSNLPTNPEELFKMIGQPKYAHVSRLIADISFVLENARVKPIGRVYTKDDFELEDEIPEPGYYQVYELPADKINVSDSIYFDAPEGAITRDKYVVVVRENNPNREWNWHGSYPVEIINLDRLDRYFFDSGTIIKDGKTISWGEENL